jgi:hypothetical protein
MFQWHWNTNLLVCMCQWIWDPLGTHFLWSKILYKFTYIADTHISFCRQRTTSPTSLLTASCLVQCSLDYWQCELVLVLACWWFAGCLFKTYGAKLPLFLLIHMQHHAQHTSTWVSAGLHPPILRNWITSFSPCLEYSLPGIPSSTCTETLSIPATHPVDRPVLQFLYIDVHTATAAPQFQLYMPHT